MKKVYTTLLVSIICMLGLFAQATLKSTDAFFIYLKGSQYQLSETDYEEYAMTCESKIYKKYRNDEFEWEDQLEQLKTNFNQKIANSSLDTEYRLVTSIEFGKYDSTRGGYIVELSDGIYFPLDSMEKSISDSVLIYYSKNYESLFFKKIALKLDSLSDYSFIPMEKDTAKDFLQGRKDSRGNVNRTVTIVIRYKLASFDSQEYNNFKDLALSNGFLPLVGIISDIEVYDTTGKTEKKIGTLVK